MWLLNSSLSVLLVCGWSQSSLTLTSHSVSAVCIDGRKDGTVGSLWSEQAVAFNTVFFMDSEGEQQSTQIRGSVGDEIYEAWTSVVIVAQHYKLYSSTVWVMHSKFYQRDKLSTHSALKDHTRVFLTCYHLQTSALSSTNDVKMMKHF